MADSARVSQRPGCDFCHLPASYDGKTNLGPWAYMCVDDFARFGLGLGEGHGQTLHVIPSDGSPLPLDPL